MLEEAKIIIANTNLLKLRKYAQPAKCYCFLRHMLLFCATVAQKVAVRQKRQVATVYAYFYAVVLQWCYLYS